MGRGNRSNIAEAGIALQAAKGARLQGEVVRQNETVVGLLIEQNRLLARQNQLLEWMAGVVGERLPAAGTQH